MKNKKLFITKNRSAGRRANNVDSNQPLKGPGSFGLSTEQRPLHEGRSAPRRSVPMPEVVACDMPQPPHDATCRPTLRAAPAGSPRSSVNVCGSWGDGGAHRTTAVELRAQYQPRRDRCRQYPPDSCQRAYPATRCIRCRLRARSRRTAGEWSIATGI